LPPEAADRFTRPFARFLKIQSATGVMLLSATVIALSLANSPWADAVAALWERPLGLSLGDAVYSRSVRDWINDGLMTLFFFVVALELKRELVHGELRSLRLASFSFAGALGGMLVPAALYLLVLGGGAGAHGWGTVMATDTAFVVGALVLVGRRAPPSLRAFLLALAIFDDVGAILIVAIGYGHALSWPALAITLGIAGAVFVVARSGVRSMAAFWILGVALWFALDASGLHPTIAGVLLGLMTPARAWISDARLQTILGRVLAYPSGQHWSGDTADREDLRRACVAAREALSPVEQLEMQIHPWSGFVVMPLFALANAGVAFSWGAAADPIVFGTLAGLVIGKPLGVFAFSRLSVAFGVGVRPPGLRWSVLAAGAALTGIGFTMSLFIAELAFEPAALGAAKIGIMAASVSSAAIGIVALRWLASAREV
jgi:NhaA family Na+:H+ antiporter